MLSDKARRMAYENGAAVSLRLCKLDSPPVTDQHKQGATIQNVLTVTLSPMHQHPVGTYEYVE